MPHFPCDTVALYIIHIHTPGVKVTDRRNLTLAASRLSPPC
jgi:hypothetical protein